MKPVAVRGKAHSVKRTLPLYFARGLTLQQAIRKADEVAERSESTPEARGLLYPNRIAKMAIQGEV